MHQEDLAAVRAVRSARPFVAQAARAVAEALRAGGRLLYVGAGTSGRLGVLDASECPPTFGTAPSQVQAAIAGGRRALTSAVEGAEDDKAAGAEAVRRFRASPRDVVCGISASASTPYVLGALAEARRRRARTMLVCCNPPRPRTRVDWVILAPTGPELVAGSTRLKAGTATKLILNAITTAAFISLGTVYRGRMVAELTELPLAQARRLLSAAGGSVKVALAMHFTRLGRAAAQERLQRASLRALEQESSRSRGPQW